MRISSHVFYYSIALGGSSILAYAFTTSFGPSEDKKLSNLRMKYADDGKRKTESQKAMQDFFDVLKLQSDSNKVKDIAQNHSMKINEDLEEKKKRMDEKLDALLKGGKGDLKRSNINVDANKSFATTAIDKKTP